MDDLESPGGEPGAEFVARRGDVLVNEVTRERATSFEAPHSREEPDPALLEYVEGLPARA